MVEIILNLPFGFMEPDRCAGMTIPWPVKSTFDFPSIKISALPSMTWINVSKGEIFSANPSPAAKDIRPTSPVIFLRMVFLTTELSTYSIISAIICGIDFKISELSTLPGLEDLFFILTKISLFEAGTVIQFRRVLICFTGSPGF